MSVWVDHLRRGDPVLRRRLQDDEILIHPFVVGELALGGMRQSAPAMGLLMGLREATVASFEEALAFIALHGLDGRGIGSVDVHLLIAVPYAWRAALDAGPQARGGGCADGPGGRCWPPSMTRDYRPS